MTTVRCEVCEGSGLVLVHDPYVVPVLDPWELTECVACGGAGLFRSEPAP